MRKGLSISILVLVAGALATGSGLAAWSNQVAAPATHSVVIKGFRFNPAQVSLHPGDVVEWKNEDIFTHSATADDGTFDSGSIAPGQAWKTTIPKAGTIGYHCTQHPNMTGTVLVSGGGKEPNQSAVEDASGRRPTAPSLKWVPPTSPEQFHPILVNFTASLLPLALLSEILGRVFRRRSLHDAGLWMVVYAAAITPLTAAAGWWWRHAAGPNLPQNLITVHQWLGTSAAVLFILLAVWRWRIQKSEIPPGSAYLAALFVLVLALVYQGSLGGTMAFGK